jgi:hypothetical protein
MVRIFFAAKRLSRWERSVFLAMARNLPWFFPPVTGAKVGSGG